MAIQIIESFDHIVTADLEAKGWANNGMVVSSSAVRTGVNGLRCASGAQNVVKTVPNPVTTIIVCFALRYTTLSGSDRGLLTLLEGGTEHITVTFLNSGMSIRRGTASGTAIGSATWGNDDLFHWFEIKATIDNSAGVVIVRKDGAELVNLTGQDTTNAGVTGLIDGLRLGASGSGTALQWDYDDVVVLDTTGSVNNDFPGDCAVSVLYPNGNGNSSDLVGSDSNSTDNYLLIDEATPSTADYVGGGTANDHDSYTFQDISGAEEIVAVAPSPYVYKTAVGTRDFNMVVRHGGTDNDGALTNLSASQIYMQQVYENNPGTGLAWTQSDLNNAEFGVKVK
jgi:hypothetical protein